MSTKLDEYYVLREGATQEEQWTWDEIAARCRSGEFSADTRVFLPDENRWATLGETELGAEIPAAGGEVNGVEEDPATRQAREALEQEYEDACAALESDPGSVEPWIDAGALALDLGRDDEARSHFQSALDRHPFHPRVAQEVKRRFARAEWRRFRLLERPDAAWDNVLDIVAYPFARGPIYPLIPAVLFAALAFVPRGGLAVALLGVLWCYRCMRAVASGAAEPVAYERGIEDPLRNLVAPAAAVVLVCAEWLALFWGVARLGMLIEGKNEVGVMAYIAASPVLTVALALCALAYLPAVMAQFDVSRAGFRRVVNPVAIVRGAVKMQGDYAMTLVLLFVLAAAAGAVSALTAAIPVAGEIAGGAAVSLLALTSAYVLGRLRARVAHLLG
jgi:hypothetical protein